MNDDPSTTNKRPHLLFRHWQGEARLWRAYWLIAVLGGWVFWTIVLNLVEFAILPELVAVVILISYTFYAAIGVWRCAFNVKWRVWGYIARALLIVSAVGFVYELGFNS